MSSKDPRKASQKGPKFNLSWFYVILFVAFGYIMLKNDGSEMSGKAGDTEFKEYVRKGYARNIVVYTNSSTLELYLIPDSAYHVFGDAAKDGKSRNPMLNVGIGSMESLQSFLDEAETEGWFKGHIEYKEKDRMFSQFLWICL